MSSGPLLAKRPRTAAEWFARRHAPQQSANADTEFGKWLAQGIENRSNYSECELGWLVYSDLRDDAEIQAMLAAADQYRRSLAFRLQTRLQQISASLSLPDVVLRPRLLVSALIMVIAVGIWLSLQYPDVENYRTAVGEQRSVSLPDGSVATLNTSTAIRVSFARDRRTVELQSGEATFAVAKDASRPFEVRALDGTTRAVGTQFNVMISGTEATVSVLEGRVLLFPTKLSDSTAAAAPLSEGKAATYVTGGNVSPPRPADIAKIIAWHRHQIEFDHETLASVLQDYNRYTTTPIVVGSPKLEESKLSGVIAINDEDALLFALKTTLHVKVIQEPGRIVILDQ